MRAKDKSVNGEGGENAGISIASGMGKSCRKKKNDVATNCDPGCHTTVVGSGECAEQMAYGIWPIVRADRPGRISCDASFGYPGNV